MLDLLTAPLVLAPEAQQALVADKEELECKDMFEWPFLERDQHCQVAGNAVLVGRKSWEAAFHLLAVVSGWNGVG
jgi:hypothetical protein